MIEALEAADSIPAATPLVALDEGPLFGLPLADLWFALVFFLLGTFLFLDGWDFGVGALFATRDDEAGREQLLAAVGPFWDGNEVWLVVFGGALFAAFPAAYAGLFSRYYLLMFAILGALIVRGLSPEMYEQRHDDRWRRLWGRAFVVGSVAAPFFLGTFAANWLLGSTGVLTLPGIVVGLAAVALCVVAGAAFLGVKTRGDLREEMGRYGVRAAVAYLALIVLALAYVFATRPDLRGDLLSPPSIALLAVTIVAAGGFVAATRAGRYYVALGSVGALVYALVALIAVVMYPSIDPGAGLTVTEGVVSSVPLNLMSVASLLLLPLVFVYFGVLYSAFSGPVDAESGYGG
jgi:cytochrome d ubiquinol oxidase subunit II